MAILHENPLPSSQVVKSIPKILLHTHLEGSIPFTTLEKLSERNGLTLPTFPFVNSNMCHGSIPDWSFFRHIFFSICSCFKKAEDFQDAVVEYAEHLCMHHVLYCEFHFSPWKHVSRGVSMDDIAQGLLCGLEAVNRKSTPMRAICDFTRHPDEDVHSILDWLLDLPRLYFPAIGISGGSGAKPRADFIWLCDKAHSSGLSTIVHAGELDGPESVLEAVELLHTDRIAHGVRSIEDPSLLERLISQEMHFELCPTANNVLGVGLPYFESIRRMLASGASCSINTDDELVFRTNPSFEIEILLNKGIIDIPKVWECELMAVSSAFATSSEKDSLRVRLEHHHDLPRAYP